MSNPELQMTLDEAVGEVLGLLTGLDLTYDPELDRYRAITRQLNRALRANALENEWSWYSTTALLGSVSEGDTELVIPINLRVRIIDDDALRLVDSDGFPLVWAYFLPRDSLHKYARRIGLWCSVVRRTIVFSRPLTGTEDGLEAVAPVMREPRMFRLPEPGDTVPEGIRLQPIDFEYPDAIVTRAAFFYAQTDPVMQPRVQTLEQGYKDVMYQLIERDTKHTDSAYINEFLVPVEGSLRPAFPGAHTHPHA